MRKWLGLFSCWESQRLSEKIIRREREQYVRVKLKRTGAGMQDIQTIVDANPRMTTEQASRYLGLQVSTLETWRCRGGGPQFVKLGRAVRYLRTDLDAFLDAGRRSITAEA